MAIKTDIIDERGNIYYDQYVRVEQIHARKKDMDIDVGVFDSHESALAGIPPHRMEHLWYVEFNSSSVLNQWEQAYSAMKKHWPNHENV